jgi:hypothetical protein
MSETVYLFLVPIAVSLALIPLRRQRPIYWWFALVALVIVGIVLAVRGQADWRHLGQGALLAGLPLAVMLCALRADVFRRRLYLIPILGPVFYLVGVSLSLAIGVATGVLEP